MESAVWIYGERAIAAVTSFLPTAFNVAGAKHIAFGGHCSESTVVQLCAQAGDDRQVVIGVGGGALLDTAKVVARRLGLPLVAIPTIAATCAAWTPLFVWYNDEGQALRFEIFNDANHLAGGTHDHSARAAGIPAGRDRRYAGEYEALVLSPQPENLPLTVCLGIEAALSIRNVLLNSS